MLHPAFPLDGPVSVTEHANGPIPLDMLRIMYSEEDERVLEEFRYAQGAPLLIRLLYVCRCVCSCALAQHMHNETALRRAVLLMQS